MLTTEHKRRYTGIFSMNMQRAWLWLKRKRGYTRHGTAYVLNKHPVKLVNNKQKSAHKSGGVRSPVDERGLRRPPADSMRHGHSRHIRAIPTHSLSIVTWRARRVARRHDAAVVSCEMNDSAAAPPRRRRTSGVVNGARGYTPPPTWVVRPR